MTRCDLLIEKLKSKGIKQEFVADKIGMTPQGLSVKLKNGTEWKASQIAIIQNILDLTPAEVDFIFFAPYVDAEPTVKE